MTPERLNSLVLMLAAASILVHAGGLIIALWTDAMKRTRNQLPPAAVLALAILCVTLLIWTLTRELPR